MISTTLNENIGVTQAEINDLAKGVASSYHADVVRIACLMCLTKSAFSRFTSSDMSPLLKLQDECIEVFMRDRGIDAADVSAAGSAIERAGRTAEYLNALPA